MGDLPPAQPGFRPVRHPGGHFQCRNGFPPSGHPGRPRSNAMASIAGVSASMSEIHCPQGPALFSSEIAWLGLILSALPIRPLDDPPPSLGLCLRERLAPQEEVAGDRLNRLTKRPSPERDKATFCTPCPSKKSVNVSNRRLNPIGNSIHGLNRCLCDRYLLPVRTSQNN